MDVAKYAADYAKQHAYYEKRVAPIFYRALADSVLPVIQTLNPNNLRKDVWQPAYKRAYKLVGQSAAMREYKFLKRTNQKDDIVSFLNDLFAQRMSAYGVQIGFNWENELTDTTLTQIQKAFADAGLGSYSNRQTADLIYKYTLGVIGRNRSMLIARTETTTATNYAKIEGAKEYFKEIGEADGYKMWISRNDSHVRHDHILVNETAVPFNSTFDVGGFDALVPGDPSLPGKERIQCRCTFVSLSAAGYRRRFGKG
jgi:hypothetical protein